jgi:hypothetical protein
MPQQAIWAKNPVTKVCINSLFDRILASPNSEMGVYHDSAVATQIHDETIFDPFEVTVVVQLSSCVDIHTHAQQQPWCKLLL